MSLGKQGRSGQDRGLGDSWGHGGGGRVDSHVRKSVASAITGICDFLSPSNAEIYPEPQIHNLTNLQKAKLFANEQKFLILKKE